MRKTQSKIISVSCLDTVVKNYHKFTSIFSLNTDSFEKVYKELEIVLYHGLKIPGLVVKKLGLRPRFSTHFSVF